MNDPTRIFVIYKKLKKMIVLDKSNTTKYQLLEQLGGRFSTSATVAELDLCITDPQGDRVPVDNVCDLLPNDICHLVRTEGIIQQLKEQPTTTETHSVEANTEPTDDAEAPKSCAGNQESHPVLVVSNSSTSVSDHDSATDNEKTAQGDKGDDDAQDQQTLKMATESLPSLKNVEAPKSCAKNQESRPVLVVSNSSTSVSDRVTATDNEKAAQGDKGDDDAEDQQTLKMATESLPSLKNTESPKSCAKNQESRPVLVVSNSSTSVSDHDTATDNEKTAQEDKGDDDAADQQTLKMATESLPSLKSGEYDTIIPVTPNGLMIHIKKVQGSVVFDGYSRCSDGRKGPAETCNAIRNIGDKILAVNGVGTTNKEFRQVLQMLRESRKNQLARLRLTSKKRVHDRQDGRRMKKERRLR